MKNNVPQIAFVVLFGLTLVFSFMTPTALAYQQTENHFYLVSLGVGDPDLITLRAINTIRASDVIVCRDRTKDELVEYLKGKTILDPSMAGWRRYRKDCASIKDPKARSECQKRAESRAQLIKQIRDAVEAGQTVSVLGSGDLMIYGGPYRWYLEEFKDLNPKIIPGVSCFNAANAALGKDIMSGKACHSAVLTTFREIDKLAGAHPTMVIFTMHTQFNELVEKLKTHYPVDTPIAIVFHAGYKQKEHIVRGRLNTIIEQTKDKKFPFEHLVYVGDFMK
ncbi:cobalt-precorrin-4 C(11)-methyltransferase [Desulfosarcina ovata subsp. sediminis]|uniref:Cobalt-precorrin-4 C(11)-methyltransferase n=1 Tax=Desulfosarcina ovata subsp. sediminis TaxID=885957 RepID=A0A5K7ZMA0_9BACT|nr:SAM-dependent methyltransferase [Desulfosarcina ovata]BBO82316.1 cobalt-precorrin-4 C(11)-methyltransferase [Desulfosarcina ovata subsp. sediminis]